MTVVDFREGVLRMLGYINRGSEPEKYSEVTRLLLVRWKKKLDKEKKESYFVDS
jgi:hypothetical protein